MTRRTEERTSPKKLFDEVVFSALDWPLKSVRLERSSLQDYCQRPVSPQISLAELYHENSKLFTGLMPELAATRVDADAVRREFLRRRSAAYGETPGVELDAPWQDIVSATVQTAPPELFYAVELRLVLEDRVIFHEPVSNRYLLLKRMSGGEQDRLGRALRIMAPQEPVHSGPMLFLVGSFARNDLLFGARGYRRTLVEAGRVAESALRACRQLGVAPRLCTEFSDRDVDMLLDADGVEEGVVIAIESGGALDVR